MTLTKKIRKALNKAAILHEGQKRKNGEIPYFVHLASVGMILSEYTDDEDVVVAGILHDCLEDVAGYSYKDLKNDFGEKIADIVKEVSEDKDPNKPRSENPPWEERKKGYLEKLKKDSKEALLVSAADKLHNIASMIDSEKAGYNMRDAFNAPISRRLWFHGEVVKIVKERLDNPIVEELEKAHEESLEVFE